MVNQTVNYALAVLFGIALGIWGLVLLAVIAGYAEERRAVAGERARGGR